MRSEEQMLIPRRSETIRTFPDEEGCGTVTGQRNHPRSQRMGVLKECIGS